MEESKRKLISDAFAALPVGCKYTAATEAQLDPFESVFVPIPESFGEIKEMSPSFVAFLARRLL